jgi:hypothetical protein
MDKKEPETTRNGLQALQDAPLILNPAEEPLNSTSIENNSNVNSPVDGSMSVSHWGSGYNSQLGARISGHNVFVLGVDGRPLTPTTNAKARKLLKGGQAKSVWNKFGLFGIQMTRETGTITPKTVLGVDFGTKYEGYAVVTGKENNLSVMWKLPDKKKLVRKIEERKQTRKARRGRNCRRRSCRHDNRNKNSLIAPSQLMIIQSRMKAIKEFFKCYPIIDVALEDMRFNHRDNKWGNNFSTVETGKKIINDWIIERAYLQLFLGIDTEVCREQYDYKKSGNKSAEIFNSHCSDALAIATDLHAQKHIDSGLFIVVDDTYRPVRRQLHDTQFSKGGKRDPYSSGNIKGIRKRTMCNFGQICGGGLNRIYFRNFDNKRISITVNKLLWLSHNFKTNIQFLKIEKAMEIKT